MVDITHIFEFIYLYNSRSAELYWTRVMKRLVKYMCTLCTRYICYASWQQWIAPVFCDNAIISFGLSKPDDQWT